MSAEKEMTVLEADHLCSLPASLQGARVLLTGASAGVGEELAYHYARLGSHLVLTAHTEALLQKVVGNCRKLGAPKIFYIAADMASPEVPERVVQFALDKLGGLDYLVLNHLGAAPAGTRARSAQATRWLLQVLRPSAPRPRPLPALAPPSRGRLCSAYPRAPPLSVQAPPPPGPGSALAALAVIRGGATRASGVFYPWRFHLLCLLRGWLPRPGAWFIRQELNVTAAAAAA
nr:PREDICTED: hydroxysteroid 11-beta-dehydrogenase 1-like protein [Equus przewalskii]